jgi:hypothetical protein
MVPRDSRRRIAMPTAEKADRNKRAASHSSPRLPRAAM